MGQTIDCTTNGLTIFTYEEDIEKLEEMKKLYLSTKYLDGTYFNDMLREINIQIEHCKECINNIKQSN